MKRNRKAEAFTKQRKLNKQETELKYISVLLTELETASAQVLREHFNFTDEQIDRFLELIRGRFQAIRAGILLFADTKKRLSVVAQRYGLAAMQILCEAYGFEGPQADRWLQEMIKVGNTNREKQGAQANGQS